VLTRHRDDFLRGATRPGCPDQPGGGNAAARELEDRAVDQFGDFRQGPPIPHEATSVLALADRKHQNLRSCPSSYSQRRLDDRA